MPRLRLNHVFVLFFLSLSAKILLYNSASASSLPLQLSYAAALGLALELCRHSLEVTYNLRVLETMPKPKHQDPTCKVCQILRQAFFRIKVVPNFTKWGRCLTCISALVWEVVCQGYSVLGFCSLPVSFLPPPFCYFPSSHGTAVPGVLLNIAYCFQVQSGYPPYSVFQSFELGFSRASDWGIHFWSQGSQFCVSWGS